PEFRAVDSPGELRDALSDLGYPGMLKAREGGYDGRGNLPVESPDDVDEAFAAIDGPAMVEEFVPFDRELSVIGIRGKDKIRTFAPGENIHEAEILRETVVPARVSDAVHERAKAVARDVLELMDGRGVFGIELFEESGEISVNEIAPRPHTSSHRTIESAQPSQSEQHLRSVLGWPLGSTAHRGNTVMKNFLGDVDEPKPAALSGVEAVLAESR